MKGSCRCLTFLVALIAAAPPVRAAEAPPTELTLELEVKAAYLYNMIDFVVWPTDAFASDADAVRVCVVGTDPFGALLDRTMQGPREGKRPIVVERRHDETMLDGCHVLFVPRGSGLRTASVIRAVAARPVLTVGETADFLARGGMIAFAVDSGRVRFDVNLTATTARGLVVSSRLLRVARQVIRKEDRP